MKISDIADYQELNFDKDYEIELLSTHKGNSIYLAPDVGYYILDGPQGLEAYESPEDQFGDIENWPEIVQQAHETINH